MDKRLYWLWLQYVIKPAGDTKALLEVYGTAENFYNCGEEEWKSYFQSVHKKGPVARYALKVPQDFSETVDFCDKHALNIITPDSDYYPKSLLDIENYPLVLFVRGDYTCLNNDKAIAVIGSRIPCVYGENAAKNIVGTLSENGALIVSGGALGIDSIAHKAAIDHSGKTVLVMGCGHGYDYLRENADLRKSVTMQGACISEYPPFSPVTQNSFPDRNRIISGMSKTVVIIEAADRSGTFNTANHAKKQGRKLLVLPGDIESGNFAGSNQLINEGATPIFSGENVLVRLGLMESSDETVAEKTGKAFEYIYEKSPEGKNQKKKPKKTKRITHEENRHDEKNQEKTENIIKNLPAGISKNAEIVYNIMSDGINELDDIKRKAQLEVRQILVALTELEILGFAEAYAPGCYRIK